MHDRFPTIDIRYNEVGVAIYSLISGIFMLALPSVFDAPVYDPWRLLGLQTWGSFLMIYTLCHFGAIWLNGRSRLWSRIVRSVACVLHLWVSISFGLMFLQNAIWGAVLFFWLIPWLLLPIIASIFSEMKFLRESHADT